MPDNPWEMLPATAPFVLPHDLDIVGKYNERAKGDSRLQLSVLPEPYLGNPGAPVVLLNLNPGYHPTNDPVNHARPEFIRRNRENLLHASTPHPFYLLDPTLIPHRTQWWDKRLRRLIEATSLASVTNNVLCVEYFPYHSRKSNRCPLLPSQQYSFAMVKIAVSRGATILLMRSSRKWRMAVPELEGYSNLYEANNFQCSYVTRNNYNHDGRDGFDAAVRVIRA